MRLHTLLAAIAGVGAASMAQAAIIFSYGSVTSLGGSNFSVPLLVRSDVAQQVRGAVVYQVIGDGGSFAGGTTTTPAFGSVNLKPTGGLFASVPDNVIVTTNQPQVISESITLQGATFVTIPTASTLLATVTFNAAGLSGRTFSLSNNIGGAPSNFTPSPTGSAINVNNLTATITIPEPATLAAAACAGLTLLRRRRPVAA